MPTEYEYQEIRTDMSPIPIGIVTTSVKRAIPSAVDFIRPVQPMTREELERSRAERRRKQPKIAPEIEDEMRDEIRPVQPLTYHRDLENWRTSNRESMRAMMEDEEKIVKSMAKEINEEIDKEILEDIKKMQHEDMLERIFTTRKEQFKSKNGNTIRTVL